MIDFLSASFFIRTAYQDRTLNNKPFPSSLTAMRYLAWIAIFSLQLSMFVCEAGIDVCLASETPAQIETTQSIVDHNNLPVDSSTCTAHAAHVFLGDLGNNQPAKVSLNDADLWLLSLNISDFFKRIEQPPKHKHS